MKDVTAIRKKMESAGYRFKLLPAGHIGIYTPTGQRVRMADGRPLNFANTPSDFRAVENMERSLAAVGINVNELEPRKKMKPKAKAHPTGGRVPENKVTLLRAKLHGLMHDFKLSQSDVYHFADELAITNGEFKPKGSQTALSTFVRGGGMTEQTYGWLTNAVDAIADLKGQIPSKRRGKASTNGAYTPPVIERTIKEMPEVGVNPEGESAPRAPTIPTLALDAMGWIYREDKDHDAIAALVLAIAELEMKS